MRCLVIGAKEQGETNKSNTRFVSWDLVDGLINITEYQCVIFRLDTIDESDVNNTTTWDDLTIVLEPRKLIALLESGGNCFVIGDSMIRVKYGSSTPQISEYFGIRGEFDKQLSSTSQCTDKRFSRLLASASGQDRGVVQLPTFASQTLAVLNTKHARLEPYKIAVNHAGDHTAWGAILCGPEGVANRLEAKAEPSVPSPDAICASEAIRGNIVFLPSLNMSDDVLTQELSLLCENDDDLSIPGWLEGIKLPNEGPLHESVSEVTSKIESLLDELEKCKDQIEEMRSPLKLLYLTNRALENEVRRAFSEIGCDVVDSSSNEEDGTIEFEGSLFALEVKSSETSKCNTDAIRQAGGWRWKLANKFGRDVQGLVVYNSQAHMPLAERKELSDDAFVRFSEYNKVAFLTSFDLMLVVLAFRRDKVDVGNLLGHMFTKTGPVDVSKFIQVPVSELLEMRTVESV